MIGGGVYTLSEVARYTGIAPGTVRAWFRPQCGHAGSGPLFQSDYRAVDGDYAVSFLNLVESYVARYFRLQGVKVSRIRRVYGVLQNDLNSPHPFAREELYTDGIDIFRRVGQEVETSGMVDVLTRPKQRIVSQWRCYLAQFDYMKDTKLTTRWRIAPGVVIDPSISFGKPVVGSTGITTYVLARQYTANRRNAALVADLYGVCEQDVLNAVRFEAQPSHRPAA